MMILEFRHLSLDGLDVAWSTLFRERVMSVLANATNITLGIIYRFYFSRSKSRRRKEILPRYSSTFSRHRRRQGHHLQVFYSHDYCLVARNMVEVEEVQVQPEESTEKELMTKVMC